MYDMVIFDCVKVTYIDSDGKSKTARFNKTPGIISSYDTKAGREVMMKFVDKEPMTLIHDGRNWVNCTLSDDMSAEIYRRVPAGGRLLHVYYTNCAVAID
jgi:hypothetical protein